MLYPESLEQFSNVTKILSEDYEFKVESLLNLKEVQKIVMTKEELVSLLTTLTAPPEKIISLSEDKEKGKIIVDDKLMLYSFINLPHQFNQENVKTFLQLKDGEYSRLYKQSLFWIVASENETFNANFEKFYKTLLVEDSKPLKCNITSARMLKNAISKMIQHYSYLKETGELKASNPSSRKQSFQQNTTNDNSEMSWRKKSDVSDLSYGNSGNNNNGYHKRRQRFKSDPNEFKPYKGFYKQKNEVEEIQIQLDNVKYPLMIKNKYSNKDIVDYYLSIKDSIKFEQGNFKNDIGEIINKDKMKSLAVMERDNLDKVLPKNNPLLNFKAK